MNTATTTATNNTAAITVVAWIAAGILLAGCAPTQLASPAATVVRITHNEHGGGCDAARRPDRQRHHASATISALWAETRWRPRRRR